MDVTENNPKPQTSTQLVRNVKFMCGHENGLIPQRPMERDPSLPWPVERIEDHECHFCDFNMFRQCLNQVLRQYEEEIAPLAKRLRNNVLYMKSITPEGSDLRKAHWVQMNQMKMEYVGVVQEGDERWTSRWGVDADAGIVEEYIDKAWTLGENIE